MKKYQGEKTGIVVRVILIAIIVVIVICSFLTTVPTGFVGIRTRFGKAQEGILQEGLNIKFPIMENIVRIDCRTQKIETTSEASTKDMQTVEASIAVNYNVSKDYANDIYRKIGKQYEDIIIVPAILESIKSTMAQYTAEELITKRAEVSNDIEATLIDKIENYGFAVTAFNITDMQFSPEYNQAIEAKAVKQQEVIAEKAELEKQQIQNEKEISIAEKDAKVMELQNSQITEKTLRLKMIEKWNGVLPATMMSDSISSVFSVNE